VDEVAVLERTARRSLKEEERKTVSKTKEHNTRNKNRVQVGKLQRQDRELKNHEAENIKGGGGARGVVTARTTIGEEIPSKL